MLGYFDIPVSWRQLLKRTFSELRADRALGLSAELAYYFFLALFPALLFLVALAGYLPLGSVVDGAMRMLESVLPPGVIDVVQQQMDRLSQTSHGGLLSLGLLGAFWSSSTAIVAIIGTLNRAYDITDTRPWWHRRVIAILLTIGLGVFILVSFALVVFGPQFAGLLAGQLGLGAVFEWGWYILQWPLVVVLVATGISLLYYFAPDADQDWVWMTPGSLVATALWLLGSLVFRYYVVNFGSYERTFGIIGVVILLLLWFYLSGLVLLIGAEMNAVIEKASPHAVKAREEAKARGTKPKIGSRAAKEYGERPAERGPHPVRGVVDAQEPPPRRVRE